MAIAATPITRGKGLLDLLRQTVPAKEQAVALYRRLLDINSLSNTINCADNLTRLQQHLAEYFRGWLPDEEVRLCLLEGLYYKRVRLSSEEVSEEEEDVPIGRGIPGSVLKTGSPLWIPDTQTSGKKRKFFQVHDGSVPRSILVLPICAKGKILGCLEMVSDKPGRLDEIEYHLGTMVVTHISSSLENVLTRQELATANAKLRDNDLRLTRLNEKLKQLAHTDEATGLHNRRRLMEQLDMEVARAKRYGEVFSCFMMDIDDFKSINDQFGHQAGDEVLRQTGELLRQSLRRSDFIARYGGEEFTVLLPRTNGAGAFRAGENLRCSFMSHDFRLDGITVKITISIGITSCTSFDRLNAKQIIHSADSALYRAKRLGKNRVCFNEDSESIGEEVRILSNV